MQVVINGVALGEFDAMDADEMEKLEKAMDSAQKEVDEAAKIQGSSAESIRAMCKPVHSMFDNVFGPGASAKLFGGKSNLSVTLNAFAELGKLIADARYNAMQELNKEVEAIGAKYSPNRAARRNKGE